MKTKLSALIAAVLLFALSSCSTAAPAQKNTAPALIRSVTEYTMDYVSGEWSPVSVTQYQYENAYPISMVRTYEDGESSDQSSFVYVFENDLPVSMEQYNEAGVLTATTEYLSGRVYEIHTENEGFVGRTLFQYANGDAYFTLLLSSLTSPSLAENTSFPMEEVDSVSVTTKDGLLEKTVNTGLYANWDADEEKEWMRFNGTYTALYDSDGIIHCTASEFRAGPPGGEDLFEVKWENGRISEIVRSIRYPEQEESTLLSRYLFAYEEIPIDPVRYAAMINAHIIGESNNYYKFFWY